MVRIEPIINDKLRTRINYQAFKLNTADFERVPSGEGI